MSSFSSTNIELPLIEKPAGEMRSLSSLRAFINTLKQHGVDSFHTSAEVTIDDWHLSLALCRAQVDTRYNKTIGIAEERKYLGWQHYTDQEHVALKRKLCGAYEEWQRFRNCWPLDLIMARMINNRQQTKTTKKSKAKAQLEQERLGKKERKRNAQIVTTRKNDTVTAMMSSEELSMHGEQPAAHNSSLIGGFISLYLVSG